ncbi:MAG: hypothetical protein JWO59_1975 [Chloroflexi bacterium]|nr:hypothetical protein [Chloroflexota bacterium]
MPASVGQERIAAAVTQFAAAECVIVRHMGSLRTVPGSSHWHLTRPGHGQGTAEITALPREGLLRASVHANREGSWAGPNLGQILAGIALLLDASPPTPSAGDATQPQPPANPKPLQLPDPSPHSGDSGPSR